MKNTCIKCKDTWNVPKTWRLKLDELDHENLEQHGQLYSIREDCSESGECESVEI